MLTAPGSLGVLDQALDRLVAVCGEQVATGTLVIAAADHPVVGRGVSAFDPAVTREVMAASVEGVALGALTARTAGLDVVLVDAGIEGPPLAGTHPMRPRGPRGDLDAASAMTIEDTTRLVDSGRALGASLAAHGLVCLGEIGVGNTTVAAALACALCEIAPELAAGLGGGAD